VRSGKFFSVECFVDSEFLETASHAFKPFEAFERDLTGTGHKLNKSRFFLFVERLQNLPHISDNLGVLRIPIVLRIGLQILHYP
jgi:hypothetical protein